jgi:PAS domain S-box-containing protein
MPVQIRPARAVGILAVLTIGAVAVSVLLLLWGLRERAVQSDMAQTTTLAGLAAQQTAQAFERSDATLRSVAARLQSPFADQLALSSLPVHLLLIAQLHGLADAGALYILDAHGKVANTTREYPTAPLALGDTDYFRAFAVEHRHGLYIGAPVHCVGDGRWAVHLARALRNPDGTLRGVLVASLGRATLEPLYAYLLQDFGRPVSLYLDDGRLLTSVPSREAMFGQPAPELAGVPMPRPGRLRRVALAGGAGNLLTLQRVPGQPMVVGVTDNVAATLASWREVALPIAGGALVVCTFIGVAALLLAHELQREEKLNRALREADDRWRRTIDSVMDAIVSVDAAQNIIMFNRAAERMFGLSATLALGRPLSMLIPERLHARHAAHVDDFAHSGAASREMAPQMEVLARRADGSEFPVESAISQTTIDGAPQLTAVLRDVTERRRREAELRRMNTELRRLSSALQSVREEERARISRELHDDLGQQLTGIKLDLSWLVARIKDGRQPAPEALDSMRQLLDGAIGAVRRISTELRPRMLDDLGFDEALAWQVGEFSRRSQIPVEVELPGIAHVQDDALTTALYRIVQESLTNIARHAGASSVRIELFERDGALVLRIRDDGAGVDLARIGSGVGVLSMRERAAALGGTFRIARHAGGGTEIEVEIPLAESALQGDLA